VLSHPPERGPDRLEHLFAYWPVAPVTSREMTTSTSKGPTSRTPTFREIKRGRTVAKAALGVNRRVGRRISLSTAIVRTGHNHPHDRYRAPQGTRCLGRRGDSQWLTFRSGT
jgi:hypothetical protein